MYDSTILHQSLHRLSMALLPSVCDWNLNLIACYLESTVVWGRSRVGHCVWTPFPSSLAAARLLRRRGCSR